MEYTMRISNGKTRKLALILKRRLIGYVSLPINANKYEILRWYLDAIL